MYRLSLSLSLSTSTKWFGKEYRNHFVTIANKVKSLRCVNLSIDALKVNRVLFDHLPRQTSKLNRCTIHMFSSAILGKCVCLPKWANTNQASKQPVYSTDGSGKHNHTHYTFTHIAHVRTYARTHAAECEKDRPSCQKHLKSKQQTKKPLCELWTSKWEI